jgi:very-short-patch-repair endonuclease
VDLVLSTACVAVEIDGGSHRYSAQKARDRERDGFLMSRGLRVIRIPNENVLNNLEGVVAFILAVASRPAADQTAQPW